MAIGRFMLVLHSHMPYVLSHGKSPHGTDWIYETAAECYLPLLDALDRLRNDGIRPRWTINVTPILAEQLADEEFKSGFERYCQEKIDTAVEDQSRFNAQGPMWMVGLAAMWQRYYTRHLTAFKHQWNRSITGALAMFESEGSIELITSAASHGYLPLLSTDESVQAQVKLAVDIHVKRFGRKPKGFWLPECAYRPGYEWKAPAGQDEDPWPRKGVEKFLSENGIEYTFVDSHLIRGGEPLGSYWQKFPQLAELFARSKRFFTPPEEFRSEYEHYRIDENLTVFARDPESNVRVWSGDVGYPGEPQYLEFHKKQYPGMLRYWRISENKQDLGAKAPYDPWAAYEKIPEHATDFVELVKTQLATYKGQADREGTLVAMYDTELFGHWWWEGPEFLYEMGLAMHNDPQVRSMTASDVITEEPTDRYIHLPEGSWGEGGYHYVWLNADNHYTWEALYPAEKRMRQMAKEYMGGPASEIVDQCARELLLAESSDWQFLISTWAARDYAEIRFKDHVERFNRLEKFAKRVHEGGSLSVEEKEFLADCQSKDAPFKDIDLRYWSQVEHPISQVGTPSS